MYTAQSRNAADEDSAYVFNHCLLTADADAQNIILGRPWRAYSTVVFLNSEIRAAVIPAGWREWLPGGTPLTHTTYAEYGSTGPGANPAARDPASRQLGDAEAARWTLAAFFNNDLDWIAEALR
jgi:pectin methylesterase-like acyl-CoA thioesterase